MFDFNLNINLSDAIDNIKSAFDTAPLSAAIVIDTNSETVSFYTSLNGDKSSVHIDTVGYRAKPFDEEFFEKFNNILRVYRENNPTVQLQKAAIVLPNSVFVTDTIRIPLIRKRAMSNSLSLAIASLYKNSDEIKFKSFQVAQNKQFATYSIVGVRKEILARLNGACVANQIGVAGITFAANSSVNAACTLNPKLKNTSFLLLDIKDNKASFSFVLKGKTVGFYSLPFGYSILYKSKVISEDLLFDHSSGELLVLNAKEKAKARQLTTFDNVLNLTDSDSDDETEEQDGEEGATASVPEASDFETRDFYGANKTARKLPKFMLRETPVGREQFVYENFRIFLKWTLDLITNNTAIVSLGMPEAVYVNMPREYDFLYDMINADIEDHKIPFAPLTENEESDTVIKNLEAFGGLYIKQLNKINNF